MAQPIEEPSQQLANLTVKSSFCEHAMERMTEKFGESWKDASKKVSYKWGSVGNQPKEGDEAELFVIQRLASKELCELLGGPVYLISGIYYIYYIGLF